MFISEDSDSSGSPLIDGDPGSVEIHVGDKYKRYNKRSFCTRCVTSRPFKSLVALFVLLLLCATVAMILYCGLHKKHSCIGKEATYKEAVVAADAHECSTVGMKILRDEQGSAADSAIATLLCLGLANAHSMGLGGGFFATVYIRAEKKAYALDARDVAPLKATKMMYVGRENDSRRGPLAMSVPGEMAGYMALHKKFGKLPWKSLFQPTIKLCNEGIPLAKGLHDVLIEKRDMVFGNPALKRRYVNPETGELHNIGDLIKYPILGKTLTTIAGNENQNVFYNGSVANDFISDIQDVGGIVTKDDLIQYKAHWRDPISISLKGGRTLHSVPPPSSGSVVGFILKVLDGYNFSVDAIKTDPVLTLHRIIETWKFAYAKRYELGDMDFVNVTTELGDLLSSKYAEAIRANITDNETHPPQYYGHYDPVHDGGTSHLSLMAANGDAVAVTSTINSYFGDGLVGSRTGIIFNDGMDDFSTPNKSNEFDLPPSPFNFIQPGKRPMSSMSPTIITDDVTGDVKFVVGASGGSKIISSTSYVTLRALFFDESLKEATDALRLHHQWIPNEIEYEENFDKLLIQGLAAKGHKLLEVDGRGSICQSVESEHKILHGYSDARKGGCPAGY